MTELIVWILASLVILFLGAEWLVRGSASLAQRLGLTPLLIGLTVVAYGTGTPELVVSTKAALDGQGDIAVGNVIGSNLFNIGIILGLSALVHPLRVKMQLILLDTPIMIAVTVLLWFFLNDARVDRIEASIFFAGIFLYTLFNVRLARREVNEEVKAEFADAVPRFHAKLWVDVFLLLGGLIALLIGSRILVTNSVSLAQTLGVSEAVIGLTIVAAGTSMPELATSVIAAWRKQPDIAIGNVVGSNIYNILGILGASGLLAPLHAPGIQRFDLYCLLASSVLLLPLIRTRFELTRWEGALLAAAYCGYVYVLWPK